MLVGPPAALRPQPYVVAEIADVIRIGRYGRRRLRGDGIADLDQAGTIGQPEPQHTPTQGGRDVEHHIAGLQPDAFQLRGRLRRRALRAQSRHEQQAGRGIGRAHARH
ncbi:hypothetical protein D9M69_678640 [compost metagenome]